MGCIMETPAAGVRRSQGFRSLSQRVFIRSSSDLVNMLVGIMSRPSSITSQIPPCTPELWPMNCPKLGFLLSKSKSFRPVLIKLVEHVGGNNILSKFYNLPNPLRHSWIMALELSKNRISGICSPSQISCSQKCCHYHWIYHKYSMHILSVWHSCLMMSLKIMFNSSFIRYI